MVNGGKVSFLSFGSNDGMAASGTTATFSPERFKVRTPPINRPPGLNVDSPPVTRPESERSRMHTNDPTETFGLD